MIFKVLYQDLPGEVPVRERTESLYVEAESIGDVRRKMSKHNYNVENIIALGEAHLAYEQKSDDFTLENV